MLSTLASLVLLAGPHGLEAKSPVELVTQLESRLPKWLSHSGDRKALLANKKEIDAFMATLPISPADRKRMAKRVAEDQQIKSEVTTYDAPDRAVVRVTEGSVGVDFFNGKARCSIGLFAVGPADDLRYVVLDGPLVDDRTFESSTDNVGPHTTQVFLEKKDGAWAVKALPAKAPPDCNALLKKAAKAVWVAEKSYFAEYDTYEAASEKIGLMLEDGAKATIKVTPGANGGFTADVTLNDGAVQITDKSPDPTVVKSCTK